ncbi:hypothetical protein ACWFRJ_23610 [Streptomyces sp. NPDC055239]
MATGELAERMSCVALRAPLPGLLAEVSPLAGLAQKEQEALRGLLQRAISRPG